MSIRTLALALLVAAASAAEEHAAHCSVSVTAMEASVIAPSFVRVEAPLAAGVLEEVEVEVRSATGRRLLEVERRGDGTGTLTITGLPLALGQRVDVEARVRRDARARRAAVCRATAPVGRPVEEKVTATVGVAGGKVVTPGGLSLEIPHGALDGDLQLQVAAVADPGPAGLPAYSPVYQFLPEGLVFAKPVRVTLPVAPGVTAASVYWTALGTSTYEAVGGTLGAGGITVETAHFSHAVVGPPSSRRTVTGVGQVTWLSASARVSEPIDFTAQPVEALLPDGAGGYTTLTGTGALGTFRINAVPSGPYLLRWGNQYLVTSSSAPDLGSVAGGRPASQRTPVAGVPLLNLKVTNLAPWTAGGWLEAYSTEANDWDFQVDRFVADGSGAIAPGATSADLAIDLSAWYGQPSVSLIEGSKGDRTVVAQLVTKVSDTGVPYQAIARAAVLPPFDSPADGPLDLGTLALADVSQSSSVSFEFHGSAWVSALLQDASPNETSTCAFCSGFVGVLGQGGDAEDGFYEANSDPLIVNDTSPAGSDFLSGTMTFGALTDPALFGNWGLMFYSRWQTTHFPAPLPGTKGLSVSLQNRGLPDRLAWATTLANGQAAPIEPPVTLVTGAQVNGQPFFPGGASIGTNPTVSWSAPRVGAPDFYVVNVKELYANANNRTALRLVASVVTPDTSFTLPPGLLQAGSAYVFGVDAHLATTAAAKLRLANAPFRSSNDLATSSLQSGVFWTGPAPVP